MKKTPAQFAATMAVGPGRRTLTPAEASLVADGIVAYLEHIGVGVTDRPLDVGDRVRWTSSNAAKNGEIVAIVPVGMTPARMGHKVDGGMSRDTVSYLVKGRRLDQAGKPVGSATLYWPLTSLLKRERI